MKSPGIRALLGALAGLVLSGCGLIFGSSSKVGGADPSLGITATPLAVCGPGSQPETGLQGQVSKADRDSGRSLEGYWCNLELVSKAQHGEGASWQFTWYEDCGYYGTLMGEERQTQQGAVVVDASDAAHPVVSAILGTPAMLDPHESLKVNEKRALLGAGDFGKPSAFDVYDVAGDCAHPKLLASVPLETQIGHEGEWSPDGRTYWNSGGFYNDYATGQDTGGYYPIDVSDPTQPSEILVWNPGGYPHGLSISDDGLRGYFTTFVTAPLAATNAGETNSSGLVIANTSDIQYRRPNPAIHTISTLTWTDGGSFAQSTIPVTIRGKPYVIITEEITFGAARIIDISDETNPFIVSTLRLEIQLAENRATATDDGATGIVSYDSHYCTVPQRHEPEVMACGYNWSGIRVFDIRDPAHPREIAYFMPGGVGDKPVPGSSNAGNSGYNNAAGKVDRCPAQVRFVKERGELWTQCQDNEFMILKFTNGVWPFEGTGR